MLKVLREKARHFKVKMINMWKDIKQNADDNKHEQMGCISRGIDVIKEQSPVQVLEMKNTVTGMKMSLSLDWAQQRKKAVNLCL